MKPAAPLAAALAAVVLLSGCGSDANSPERSARPEDRPGMEVHVTPVAEEQIGNVLEAPGTVRAAVSARLSSKVTGYVRELRVRPGDRVAAGQLLALIDARQLDAMLLQAKAAEHEARNGIAEADNAVRSAGAQLALAQATFNRMEGLYASRSISTQEFEEAQARLRTAEAAAGMAASRRSQLDAKIEQARQGVESAIITRSDAELRAPFAGIVTEKNSEAGQMATPGAPLLTIEQAGPFRLEASVEESLLSAVRLGETVSVLLDAFGEPVSARVTEIVPAVDAASRSFLVKATLPSLPGLRSGMFGRLRIARGSHPALIIPVTAVTRRGDIELVMIAESGVARSRMVTTGIRRNGRAEILSGLRAGEKVIHPVPAALVDGAKVEVR